jgi:hypothetical protein
VRTRRLPLGRRDLEGVALEAGGIAHAQAPLGEQGDDLRIERIDPLAQRAERRRLRPVAGSRKRRTGRRRRGVLRSGHGESGRDGHRS